MTAAATIHEAAELIRQKQLTPVDLVEQCLANVDRWEKHVRAWVFVDREGALAEARRLTDELGRGQYRGPLHGIPIGVKDIFDVYDWPTAAGSKRWANSIAREDAEVVKQLRQAGCIFLGKTVTTQFASFDPPVTRNPWNLDRTPGGSSSGSAAAVATGMCLGALGSQTGGSITRPASYCGVAGCKPTYGLVSCRGVVPLAPSMDHPGPMARCAEDLAILLRAMWNFRGRQVPTPDVETFGDFDLTGFREARGMFREMADDAVRAAVDEVCNHMRDEDRFISELTLPAGFSEILRHHRVIMAVEAAQFHGLRLQNHPDDYEPRIRELVEEGLRYPALDYERAKHARNRLVRAMNVQLDETMLIAPATMSPAPDTRTTGNPAFNSPWSYLGLPAISIPIGFSAGLPLAIQLVGRLGDDEYLLAAAAWLERVLDVGPLNPKLPARSGNGSG